MPDSIQQKLITITPEEAAAAAVLANELGEQMLLRLEWVLSQPKVILDVGCGAGYDRNLLKNRYPEAQIIAVDLSHSMLQYAKKQSGNLQHDINNVQTEFVAADVAQLPLKDNSVDLVFANLVMPWCKDHEKLLQEWKRVLRPEGLLMFTSLGPDTLQTWREHLGHFTLPDLIDMHDIGDALTKLKFADPVLDVEHFTLTYRNVNKLFHELQASGIIQAGDYADLMQSAQLPRSPEGLFETTYEVVYGHAWVPPYSKEQPADEEGIVKFPLSHLRNRRS